MLLAELQQIHANQQAAAAAAHAAGEQADLPLQSPLEEAIAALFMSGTASTSASTTPSAAISMTPSAPSGPVFGSSNLNQLPNRRQTIGFARFKTRADALAAKEQLQGRKIDSLTGATLKAEMAKKNLHTKRSNPADELAGILSRSRVSGLANTPNSTASQQIPNQSHPSSRDAWEWQANDKDEKALYGGSFSAQPPANSSSLPTANHASPHSEDASVSPPASIKSPNQRPTDSKALLALAEEADEMEGWSVGGAVGLGMDGYSSRGPSSSSVSQGPPAPPHLQTGQLGMYRQQDGTYGTSPPSATEHMDSARGLGLGVTGANPADQNPPINTLYVGNLPAISPPTHPPNFLEESLRALFVRCSGYKRMSFRQKINGPMCFVEFDDVPFAAQAIKDLYGHNLGGLVKGGIRLSYSKNSLGQRGNGYPAGAAVGGAAAAAGSQYGAPHNVPMSPSAQAPTPGYGLQLSQAPAGAPTGPQSAPIPMPGDIRRRSESTGLSPTAQPFNASLPLAASPRSRYFGSSPSRVDSYAFAAGSTPSSTQGQPIPAPSSSNTSAQFSPVSSPIRTPASYSWVSSGQSNTSTSGMGNGYAFDPFAGGSMSLSGAASAWQSGTSGTPMS